MRSQRGPRQTHGPPVGTPRGTLLALLLPFDDQLELEHRVWHRPAAVRPGRAAAVRLERAQHAQEVCGAAAKTASLRAKPVGDVSRAGDGLRFADDARRSVLDG